jgi:REP element-mobilizing transposase RayT
MAHSFVNNNLHCVFSAKERLNLIRPEFQERLWKLIVSVAVERGMRVPAIGGVENHIHILLFVPAVMPLAKAIQSIKGVSSKWINEKFRGRSRMGSCRLPMIQLQAEPVHRRAQKGHPVPIILIASSSY